MSDIMSKASSISQAQSTSTYSDNDKVACAMTGTLPFVPWYASSGRLPLAAVILVFVAWVAHVLVTRRLRYRVGYSGNSSLCRLLCDMF